MITHRLLWKRDGSEGLRWYLRGIGDDGRLFGEVRFDSDDPAKRRGCLIETALSNSDREAFLSLVHALPFRERLPTAAFAFIVEIDPDGVEQRVFSYNPGDELTSDDAARFLRITELIRPYLNAIWNRD